MDCPSTRQPLTHPPSCLFISHPLPPQSPFFHPQAVIPTFTPPTNMTACNANMMAFHQCSPVPVTCLQTPSQLASCQPAPGPKTSLSDTHRRRPSRTAITYESSHDTADSWYYYVQHHLPTTQHDWTLKTLDLPNPDNDSGLGPLTTPSLLPIHQVHRWVHRCTALNPLPPLPVSSLFAPSFSHSCRHFASTAG